MSEEPEPGGRPPDAVLRAAFTGLLCGSCSGTQSALDPAGHEAAEVLTLFWVMLVGAGLIWAVVIGAAVFGGRFQKKPIDERTGLRIVLWAGAVFPTVVLAALLVFGLRLMPVLRAAEPALRIEVSGEQYWWRVTYLGPDDTRIESANELRLPVGRAVELILTSADVIHSLWIPTLAGKMDIIPGRTNRLVLRPERTGIYRGACAEFCGRSHALMAFPVVVMEPAEFDAWLARETAPASPGGDPGAFLASGCGGCHTVRGSEAAGTIGPDLTHLADRRTIGAGILPNTPENLKRFIADTERVKPGVRMPSFGMLPGADIEAIAAYLGSLK